MIAAEKNPLSTSPYAPFPTRCCDDGGIHQFSTPRRKRPARQHRKFHWPEGNSWSTTPGPRGPTAAAARGSGAVMPAGQGRSRRSDIRSEGDWKPCGHCRQWRGPNGGKPQGREGRRYPRPPAVPRLPRQPLHCCWCGPSVSCSARTQLSCRCSKPSITHLYLPPDAVALDWLDPLPGRSLLRMERCGPLLRLGGGNAADQRALWHYPSQQRPFAALAGLYALYPKPRWTAACGGWRAGTTPAKGGSMAGWDHQPVPAARSREIRSTRN